MKTPLLLVVCIGLIACARAALRTDIEYGTASGESLRLDAFVPEGAGPFPAVILVHGGGWTSGDKSGGPRKALIAPMQDPLAEAGFAWFSINYRLAPKYPFPANVEDVETAIRWVKAHAAEYRIDPLRIAISGESAGAHLAALAAVRGKPDTNVAAVVAFYGPFDMRRPLPSGSPIGGNLAAFTGQSIVDEGTLALLREASPIVHVKPGLPPFLLVHGTADKKVAYSQSTRFQARLREANVPVDVLTIDGGDHGMVSWDKLVPDYKVRVVDWLKRTLTNDNAQRSTLNTQRSSE